MGNAHPSVVPYQVFPVADGHVIIACGNDTQFARLRKVFDDGAQSAAKQMREFRKKNKVASEAG